MVESAGLLNFGTGGGVDLVAVGDVVAVGEVFVVFGVVPAVVVLHAEASAVKRTKAHATDLSGLLKILVLRIVDPPCNDQNSRPFVTLMLSHSLAPAGHQSSWASLLFGQRPYLIHKFTVSQK
jgi:hypothetical protein